MVELPGIPVPDRETTSEWVACTARVGYTAIGAVYIIIGIIALRAAWSTGAARSGGAQQAIREIGQQPFGWVLLLSAAVGLLAFVAWRWVQAIQFPGYKGTDLNSIVKRIGFAISGVIYAFLAFTAASVAVGWGAWTGGGGDRAQEWTRWVFSFPLGAWMVAIVGGCILGVGAAQFYKAYTTDFLEDCKLFQMSEKERRGTKYLGRFGLAARGVTFSIIGIFILLAAWKYDASQVKGLGEALDAIASQPFGPWLLAVVALGFIAFGLHCIALARYSYFKTA